MLETLRHHTELHPKTSEIFNWWWQLGSFFLQTLSHFFRNLELFHSKPFYARFVCIKYVVFESFETSPTSFSVVYLVNFSGLPVGFFGLKTPIPLELFISWLGSWCGLQDNPTYRKGTSFVKNTFIYGFNYYNVRFERKLWTNWLFISWFSKWILFSKFISDDFFTIVYLLRFL